MATKHTSPSRKKTIKNQQSKKSSTRSNRQSLMSKYTKKVRTFLKRRPHRSFRRTRQRDYTRSLSLPGYWSFTNNVRIVLWSNKKLFISLVVVYAVLSGIFVGIASQTTYSTLSDTLSSTGQDIFNGNVGDCLLYTS